MPNYKIFSANLSGKQSEKLHLAPLTYVKYLVGFACATNEGFNVVTTQMRFLRTEPWKIVDSNRPSSAGQLTMELGYFNPGSLISLFWVLRAVTKISSVSVYIINDETQEIRKIAPATGSKKMEHGEDWGEETIDFQLF